ncbi:MAG TPA: succinate dehydrogenase assembly factor 2 [Burkholderiales bacterium]|nr:succinate dehydrogenase assembly factor 2 [Burkholderiales bacterium]
MDAFAAKDAKVTNVEMNRLRWRCRRGRLENELVLERFLHAHGAQLEGEQLRAFENLLECSDDELWGLVSGRRECGDSALSDVVQLLRQC